MEKRGKTFTAFACYGFLCAQMGYAMPRQTFRRQIDFTALRGTAPRSYGSKPYALLLC